MLLVWMEDMSRGDEGFSVVTTFAGKTNTIINRSMEEHSQGCNTNRSVTWLYMDKRNLIMRLYAYDLKTRTRKGEGRVAMFKRP